MRPRFITRIDWILLRQQKAHINSIKRANLTDLQVESLEGILNLIDAIQDYAIDAMGLSEEEVF